MKGGKKVNITIFYFSGTGNTRWAAEQFTSILKSMDHKVNLFSLETASVWDPTFLQDIYSSTEMFGIAYPVYGSTLPPFMWQFLKELSKIAQNIPNSTLKPGFTLTTVALFSGDGALVPKKALSAARIRLIGAMNLQMASNFSIPFFRYNPVDTKKLAQRKIRNQKKLHKFANHINELKPYYEGRNPLLVFGGWLQRVLGGKEIQLFARYLSVDQTTCTQCLLCVNDCPTHSIIYDNSMSTPSFQFSMTCTACMRCYNFCPTYSIQVFHRTASPSKYLRYYGPNAN